MNHWSGLQWGFNSSSLVWQRWLAQACFLGGPSLIPAPVEVAGLSLLPWMSLVQACSLGGLWPGPGWSCWGLWLRPPPPEISGLDLVPQRLLSQTCFLRGHLLLPAPTEVADQACSCRYPWLRPAPPEISGLSLVLQRYLSQAYSLRGHSLPPICSCGGHWLGPPPRIWRWIPIAADITHFRHRTQRIQTGSKNFLLYT